MKRKYLHQRDQIFVCIYKDNYLAQNSCLLSGDKHHSMTNVLIYTKIRFISQTQIWNNWHRWECIKIDDKLKTASQVVYSTWFLHFVSTKLNYRLKVFFPNYTQRVLHATMVTFIPVETLKCLPMSFSVWEHQSNSLQKTFLLIDFFKTHKEQHSFIHIFNKFFYSSKALP